MIVPAEIEALDRIVVAGAARSGRAASLMIKRFAPQIRLIVCDRSAEPAAPAELEELRAAGIDLNLGSEDSSLLEGAGLVVKSPGVPADAPLIRDARRRGVPVWGEVELAWRFLSNPVIGVTGTNGKTTTTELIGHVLRGAGRGVRVAGNVGTALSSLVGRVEPGELIVLEVSSFQLEDSVSFRPEAAILLNLSEDHLDRHVTAPDYFAAKLKIFARQRPEDIAILNINDEAVRGAALPGAAARVWFAGDGILPSGNAGAHGNAMSAVRAEAGWISADLKAVAAAGRGLRERLKASPAVAAGAGSGAALDESKLRRTSRNGSGSGEGFLEGFTGVFFWPEAALKGGHNLENALAATAVCLSLGLAPEQVAAGLKSFPGVPHRLQQVAVAGGVTYVNDSKATNVDAAVKALTAFDAGIHLIVGGRPKGCSFDQLAESATAGRVKQVIAIGEAAGEIADSFKRSGREIETVDGLEDAVKLAAESAASGDTVLLAPACASYDQYDNFEERGEHFISLVKQIIEEEIDP